MRTVQMEQPPEKRRVFVAGRLRAKTKKGDRPCSHMNHAGPLLRTDEYDAMPDPLWWGQGECARCGSTVHRSQLRRAVCVALLALLAGCSAPTAPSPEPSQPVNGLLINSEGQTIKI